METAQVCPPELRASIARARAAAESLGLAPPSALAIAAETAEAVGALTSDADLVTAVAIAPVATALEDSDDVPPETRQAFVQTVGTKSIETASSLTRLGEIGLSPQWRPGQKLNARQAETLRKMLLAVVSDPRLVLARIALQLVRLRHARTLPADEQERLAVETRVVFGPLANRLGVWQLKWELEDFAFRYLEPEDYRRIAASVSEKRVDRERYIEELCATLEDELRQAGVAAEVYGRPKHIYSIFRKMQRKQVEFEKIFDVRAVRIVVASIPDCYAALGVVHARWQYIPGEFDDYIATPKDNFYRSIHTAVTGPGGRSVEVQIRTREMQEHAELGVAAHWHYKEGGARNSQHERKIEWARRLLDPAESTEADRDFLESVRAELFEDRVYPLTPKGEVIELQRGATPLDFAYTVHTNLGHRCRGAKVNGRIVPLTYHLHNGEVVEIITGKEPAPSRHWLSADEGYLVSQRNRAKVRAWFRRQEEEAAARGGTSEPVPLPAIAEAPRRRPARRVRDSTKAGARARRRRTSVDIEGVGDLPTTLARCCQPIRPQPITGYVTLGRGVTIHRSDCPGLARMRAANPERVLNVSWTIDDTDLLAVEVFVTANDRRGLIRDLGDAAAAEKMNIDGMNTWTDRQSGVATFVIKLAVHDHAQLGRLLKRLQGLPNVLQARRNG